MSDTEIRIEFSTIKKYLLKLQERIEKLEYRLKIMEDAYDVHLNFAKERDDKIAELKSVLTDYFRYLMIDAMNACSEQEHPPFKERVLGYIKRLGGEKE